MGATLSVALLLLWAVMHNVLLSSFERAEEQQIRAISVDARAALQLRNGELMRTALNWSAWDDTYNYVVTGAPSFERSNLTNTALEQLDVDYMGLFDMENRSVFSTAWERKEKHRSPVWPELQQHFANNKTLFELPKTNSVHFGIIDIPAGPLQIIAVPIHDSNKAGARHGTLVIGSFLDKAHLARYGGNSNNTISLVRLSALNPLIRAELQNKPILASATTSELARESMIVEPLNKEEVASYQLIQDFYKVPRWALQVVTPRNTVKQGHATIKVFGWTLLTIGFIACALALLPVEFLVLRRIFQLSNDVQEVRLVEGRSHRVRSQGHDELGHLSANINATLSALEIADQQRVHSQALHQEMAQAALAAGDCFFVATSNESDSSELQKNTGDTKQKRDFGSDVTLEWQGNIGRLLGLAENEYPCTLREWKEFVHPEDWELLRHSYELAWRHGLAFSLEIRVRRTDGCELFWQHRGKILGAQSDSNIASDAAATPTKLLGMCLDITARKIAERARHRTETRLTRIAETAADAIMLYDASGHVIFANAAAARVFGCPIEALWNLTYDDPQWGDCTLEGAPLPKSQTIFRRVERERQPVYDMEYTVKRPNGEIVAVSVNATPLPEDKGSFGGVVASFTDITQRRLMEERLNHQAFHDPLTGLANRTLIHSSLKAALAKPDAGSQFAVLFIDLDNFKWVNDSLGHDKGDVLLCEVASRLQKTLRADDTPARFGGDEFVVLLENISDPNYAFAIAERIVFLLSEAFVLGGREVYTSPSIGLAFSEPGSDAETLLSNADAAMYEAKRRGKGRYEVFRDNLSAAALARLEIEGELRRALSVGEMSLAYQPKVELENGTICGVEALVRWQHPTRGAISPIEFVPIAEATGLIVPLGRWVLGEACRQTQEWNLKRETPLAVAVNVSPRQFHTGVAAGTTNGGKTAGSQLQLVQDVALALEQSGLPAHLLTLEITETVLMERTSESLEVLNALSKLGVQLAIDDFGTGYSSLAYLRTFPFDFLKIDREFVSGLDGSQSHRVIVRAIIQLAHTLGLKVIAEGAEVIGEVDCLKEFGCDQAQGYFYAKPLPGDEIEKLLAAENLIGN